MSTNCSCKCDCDNLEMKIDCDDEDDFYDKQFRDLFVQFNEQLDNYPEIKDFIQKLKKILEKQIKKIKKLKRKLKEFQEHSKTTKKDTETQTEQIVETKSIVEEITEAATDVLQETGFVYEATSGLYYDYKTGYYYNAEYGLYYDGNTGIYYKYNEETKQFDFHSQVDISAAYDGRSYESEKKRKDTKKEREDVKRVKRDDSSTDNIGHEVKSPRPSSPVDDAVEEGECTDTSDSCDEVDENVEDNVNADVISKETQEIAKAWPPCMRVIVQESKLDKLRDGTLFLITCDGGSMGREGNHAILIPDINVSKHHATISFNKDLDQYEIIDLGSRNGTLLDGKRMSVAKQESDPMAIRHGSIIQVGNTKLLCHIHSGNDTCRECEPGLQQKSDHTSIKNIKTTNRDQHKSELKRLKKKFGIDSSKSVTLAEGYSDRAQHRRETIGSSHSNEKTEVTSIDQKISSENKGFKLLKSMGWSEGESLGKEKGGLTEPVPLISNVGHTGLGCNEFIPTSSSSVSTTKKDERWRKMHERYKNVNDPDKNTVVEGEENSS